MSSRVEDDFPVHHAPRIADCQLSFGVLYDRPGVDEFSRYECWYGRDEPRTLCRLVPGGSFPLPDALCELARRRVEALAVCVSGSRAVFATNLTPARQRCRIAALPARSVAVRRLGQETSVHSFTEPASFRASSAPLDGSDWNALALELEPFAYTRVDISL